MIESWLLHMHFKPKNSLWPFSYKSLIRSVLRSNSRNPPKKYRSYTVMVMQTRKLIKFDNFNMYEYYKVWDIFEFCNNWVTVAIGLPLILKLQIIGREVNGRPTIYSDSLICSVDPTDWSLLLKKVTLTTLLSPKTYGLHKIGYPTSYVRIDSRGW